MNAAALVQLFVLRILDISHSLMDFENFSSIQVQLRWRASANS
jgi:hypothetical protein